MLLNNNQWDAAKIQFANVLALNPEHSNAAFHLGVLQLEANELELAKHSFEHVLSEQCEHVQALINLGVIALKQDESQTAVDYFTKALALDNNSIEARNNLAATFIHHDRFENALMHYDVLLKKDPHNIEYLYNIGVAQMALGHLQEAITHFEAIISQQENHFAAWHNLAVIRIRQGQKPAAILCLQQALLARPTDDASQFMLAALDGSQKNIAPCAPYVTHLFDNYSIQYEEHMQKTLHYALPSLIEHALRPYLVPPLAKSIDLGCGTGLCGALLRSVSQHVTGVDLSEKMLAIAKKKGDYDELIASELLSFLQHTKEHYALAIAADVLPYLGELEELFSTIASRLSTKGLFVFTHEISLNANWQLQSTARFSHSADYINQLCTKRNLHMLYQEKVVARQQNEQPLYEMLYVVQRTE